VDWAERVERDNENQVMLKKEWLKIRVMDRKYYDQYLKDVAWSRAEGDDDTISYAVVVSVSASYSRCSNLTFSLYTMTH